MPFNTLTFLLFFAVVLSAYKAASSWQAKKYTLLFFSQIFYAAWNPPFILLLWLTIILNWWFAQRITTEASDAKRKTYLLLSLSLSLGLLCYFKYGEFLTKNLIALLALWGIDFNPASIDVILPIGISFYTFQAMSYTIDIYRRNLKASTSLSDFALYVSFFPQLVAGPIVRASDFLPQLRENKAATTDQFGWGLILIIFGLFQKMVLADTVFAPVVDKLYSAPVQASAWDAWAGILAFSGQIFCDFSGYSTCAIGLALCFGFHFADNFRSPYGAIGFSDFWRRWHISLSSWLRDYLYISLGGNRGSALAVSRNLLLTMLLGGLWHGASWMFLLWGGLHGIFLLAERLAHPLIIRFRYYFSNSGLAVATFIVITLTWIPFRAPDPQTASAVFSALFRAGYPELTHDALLSSLACACAIVFWHIANRDTPLKVQFSSIPRYLQTLLLGLSVVGIFLVSGGESRGFIYFQF